ncbi:MAG TPA: CbiX/SirB N-terminal domain-containing protein [Limnobacter sp.]|nr:CbiX/SirB N-terminal domain-containing protein [Limnobacter sp.]
MSSKPTRAIVLFGHGARDPQWADPMKRLQAILSAQLPGVQVELAFLELMLPSLPDTVDCMALGGVKNIQVVPIFFGKGGHLKNDFPLIMADMRKKHPGLNIEATAAVGQWDAVWQAIATEIVQQVQSTQ